MCSSKLFLILPSRDRFKIPENKTAVVASMPTRRKHRIFFIKYRGFSYQKPKIV